MINRYTRRYGALVGATDMCAVSSDAVAVACPATRQIVVIGWNTGEVLDATTNNVPYFGLVGRNRTLVATAPDRVDIFDPLELIAPILSIPSTCTARSLLLSSSIVITDGESLIWAGLDSIEIARVDPPRKITHLAHEGEVVYALTVRGDVLVFENRVMTDMFAVHNLVGATDIVIVDGFLHGVGQEHIVIVDLATREQTMVDHDTWNKFRRMFPVESVNTARHVVTTGPNQFIIDPPTGVLEAPAGSTAAATRRQPPTDPPADEELRNRRLSSPFLRLFRQPNLADYMDTLDVQYGRENFPMGALADSNQIGELIEYCNGRWITVNPSLGELTWQGDELLRFGFREADAAVQVTERHSRKQYPWVNGPVDIGTANAVYNKGPTVELDGTQYSEVPIPQVVTLMDGLSLSFRVQRTVPTGDRTVLQVGPVAVILNTLTGFISVYANGGLAASFLGTLLASPNWIFIGITLVRATNGSYNLLVHRGAISGVGGFPALAILPTSVCLGGPTPVDPAVLPPPFIGRIADVCFYSSLKDRADFLAIEQQATIP